MEMCEGESQWTLNKELAEMVRPGYVDIFGLEAFPDPDPMPMFLPTRDVCEPRHGMHRHGGDRIHRMVREGRFESVRDALSSRTQLSRRPWRGIEGSTVAR